MSVSPGADATPSAWLALQQGQWQAQHPCSPSCPPSHPLRTPGSCPWLTPPHPSPVPNQAPNQPQSNIAFKTQHSNIAQGEKSACNPQGKHSTRQHSHLQSGTACKRQYMKALGGDMHTNMVQRSSQLRPGAALIHHTILLKTYTSKYQNNCRQLHCSRFDGTLMSVQPLPCWSCLDMQGT